MTISYSAAVKNARLNAIETTAGTAPLLRIYNGTVPATADTALASNTLLAVGTLPADWMGDAAAGVKVKAGTWTLTGQTGAGTGTAGTFFRLYDATGTTCHVQGTFGTTGTDMIADNASIANTQTVTVSTFSITSGN